MINSDKVFAEMEDRGMRTEGIGPDASDRITENFYQVQEEMQAAHDVEFNQQVRLILQSCGVINDEAIKAAVKIQAEWPEESELGYGIGGHEVSMDYKQYGITFDRECDSWVFEDYTKIMFMRDASLLSGLLTCDKMREQNL